MKTNELIHRPSPSHPPTPTTAIVIERVVITAEKAAAAAEETRTAANAAVSAATGFEKAMNPYEVHLWVQRQCGAYGDNPLWG